MMNKVFLNPERMGHSKNVDGMPFDMNKLVLDHLIHEGFEDIAEEFSESTGISFCKTSFLSHRAQVRNAIEDGDIDLAISKINDLNSEIIDNNVEIYYSLVEHKICERAWVIREEFYGKDESRFFSCMDEVLGFIRLELSTFVEEDPKLVARLESLLEFIIFNLKKEDVLKRRKRLAEYVNECILEKYGVPENYFKKILRDTLSWERKADAGCKPKLNDLVS